MHWKIHPPRPSRFPSGGDFAPLGPRDCPRASPSGNLSGLGVQNPRPWEISWASGSVFSNTSLLSAVYGYNRNILQWRPIKVIQIPSVWKRKENDHQILFMVTKCTDKSFCIHWILCSWRFYEPRPRIFYVNMFRRIHYKDRLESIFACSFIQGE